MERVEVTFIKHFANGNHRKGMDTLRPKARRERHRITFSLGKTCAGKSKLKAKYEQLLHVVDLLCCKCEFEIKSGVLKRILIALLHIGLCGDDQWPFLLIFSQNFRFAFHQLNTVNSLN